MYLNPAEIKTWLDQFLYTLNKHFEGAIFIYEHKLWRGIFRYGWVSKFLIVLGLIVGIKMLSVIIDWWNGAHFENAQLAMSSVGSLFGEVAEETYSFLFAGSMKYVILIFLEVIIFHFCRRTVEILTTRPARSDFNEFFRAQKRMIKVAFRSWVMEIVAVALIGAAFSVFSFLDLWGVGAWLKAGLVFVAQSFFTGFALVDNYHEQYDIPIKESFKRTRSLAGVAIMGGMLLQALMPVPLFGPVFGSLLGAVAVTLALHDLTDLHKTVEIEQETPLQPVAEAPGTSGT